MLYLLAVFLPPIAVLAAGKPVQAILNFIFLFCGVIPALIHALFIAHNHYAGIRQRELLLALAAQAK